MKDKNDQILHFGENFPDGRLTKPSNKVYELRKAIEEIERVGRPLKVHELNKFVKKV